MFLWFSLVFPLFSYPGFHTAIKGLLRPIFTTLQEALLRIFLIFGGLILVRKALILLERPYFGKKAVAPGGKIVLFSQGNLTCKKLGF